MQGQCQSISTGREPNFHRVDLAHINLLFQVHYMQEVIIGTKSEVKTETRC